MTTPPFVWLISGCSTGFGREIAISALEAGDMVAVTSRNTEDIRDICNKYPSTSIALNLDVTYTDQIIECVRNVISKFGRIDVLVNNAGYGYLSAIEEGEGEEVSKLFNTNFFGALELTKQVLPVMRNQKFGRIINNSSQAGLMANPGTGYYSASKFALEGLMEALDKEVRPLNIFVTSVQPGAFRTDWSGRSMKKSKINITDYDEHVRSRINMIAEIDGKQPGDPKKAAKIIFDLTRYEDPPNKLLLGAGVLSAYREKLNHLENDLDTYESITLSADFQNNE
ncbi:oxidoreductase [Gammaproteobacteria bacterium]|nr:oxidoreductase [Gammaproteobacteria bacterium]